MDIMEQQIVYILLWLGFCHFVQDFPMQSINYEYFSAYQVLENCPQDKKAWENASEILNCTKPKDGLKNRYHCMPNRHKTMLLEFCYPGDRVRMSPGFCFVLADNGVITKYDDTSCINFTNNSCQMSYDEANMMYKYPACLKINRNKGCFASDPACPSVPEAAFHSTRASETTTIHIPGTSEITNSSVENQGDPAEEENKDTITVIIIGIVSLISLIISAGIVYQFCYKKNWNCTNKVNYPEQMRLLEEPSLILGDITLDPEEGVKLHASLSDQSSSIKSTTWIKDGTVIDFEICHGKYSTNEKDQHLSLIIHNMDHRDEGEYSCYVTSNTGRESKPVIFNIGAAKVELDFINSIPLGEMSCAKLTAFTTCKVLHVLWQKHRNKTEPIKINQGKYSGNVFTSRQEINLYIHDVNESDAGNYWVIVKTEYGLGVSNQKELEVLQENKAWIREEWIRENDRFVSTSASTRVKELLECNKIVIITGDEGSGKSAIAHHVGLYLKNTKGYRIIPLSHIKDIFTFWQSKNTDVCYIIDDAFGRTVLDISKMFHYISILPRIQSAKHVKLLMSVSLPLSNKIFKIEKITSCAATINLSLHPLTEIERNNICKAFRVPADVQQKIGAKENFPLLCSLYAKENFNCQGRAFLSEYEKHVEENLSKNPPSILALIVLCLFNNNILNIVTFQNEAIMDWVCTHYNITKEELDDAFKSLTSAKTYLETSSYGDFVYTVKSHIILEVVVGIMKQMLQPTFHSSRIPSFIFGLFLRKLKPSKSVLFDIFFNLNSLNFCQVFQSEDAIYLLEQIDFSGHVQLDDWYEIFLSETVYDILPACEVDSDEDVGLSKSNLEFYGYALLFSMETTRDGEKKKILKTKVLWWITKFGSVPLLQNILRIKDERFLKELDRLLMISCFSNSVEKTEVLIKHGKECIKSDAEKYISFVTPVAIAFFQKNEHLLSLLKKEGAKLDNMEINGKTLLSASILIHDGDSDLKFRKFLAKEVVDVDKKDKNGETALFVASEKGDLELVKVLLKRKADVNKVGSDNRTPLFVAAEKDCYEIVKELVKNHARIDSYDSRGRSALHEASEKGYLKIVKHLVEEGAIVNKADVNKCTPLHLAVKSEQFEVAEYLISHNANINDLDDNLQSPLYIAAKGGLEKILDLLTNQGADVNICDRDAKTPLHTAIRSGNTKIVKRLLASDANTNISDKDFNRPLHFASSEEKIDIVKLLLKKNTDVNVTNKRGQTPLLIACTKGNYGIVKELVTFDTSVNIKDFDERTPLHEASKEGHKEIVEYLVEKGAIRNINFNDKNNRTPLYCACENGNTEIIRHLLKKGAIVHLCDRNNVTPLILVSKTGPLENVKLIVEHLIDQSQINRCDSDGRSPLHYAVSAQLVDVVAYLKEKKADIRMKDDSGKTPLDIARDNNFQDVLEIFGEDLSNSTSGEQIIPHSPSREILFLMLTGSNNGNEKVNINARDERGQTALLKACISRDYELVQSLVRCGASINLGDSEEQAPLHKASARGFEEIVKYLITEGANINLNDRKNKTPLYYACEEGKTEVIAYLLKKGAIVHLCDRENVTPLILVSKTGPVKNVQLIVENLIDNSQINRCDNNGKSPLHYATSANLVQVVAYLKKENADSQKKDDFGKTPLDIAREKNFLDIVNILKE